MAYAPEALDDLDAIFDFIAADNPGRAVTYIEEIRQACRSLCDMPLIGVDRPDLRPGVRVLAVRRRVVIAYEIVADRIDILRVFSGGQDYAAIMGGDS
ncbi:type II toxin-antitoxin system RelE/ParE family toxin [Roseomonas mucosa]|uniref:type II toxin-antitoxin system RelE/ParE family toxin n=1 Tax=Roseomonas mucosa TaxID=207340 RepID=UPI001EF3E34A|nr:type II toxin-antitoxin system RelE/ParE family toxin [Roseomonas mucosa]MCG7354133.1 type II toxin-antitoxin system RelE/ParE family toxin [Roseomonas mucosa]MDT8292059.1 type II toxin-antitoxin system RelE/ParE family toxin [Roseomonas mucosa]